MSVPTFSASARANIRAHAQRLNALLVGHIALSVLSGESDSARSMPALRLMFGDWLETSWRPTIRGMRVVDRWGV